MKKWLVIGISIIAAILLTFTSLTNVIGYHTVQASQRQTKKEAVNQKELLFQTILDIANNKEIQRILLKSQMMKGRFLNADGKSLQPLTKQQLNRMYLIGTFLSKIVGKSRIQSMIQKHESMDPDVQQEINTVFEKNATLNKEIQLLTSSDCGCDDSQTTKLGHPIICATLLVIMGLIFFSFWILHFFLMMPPSVAIEFLALLLSLESPFVVLYQRFNCPMPKGNNFPFISDISPADGEQNVSLSLTELSFHIHDIEGDLMSYKVTTSPDIGGGTAILVPNGTYNIPIVHPLQNGTTYSWLILIYEGDTSGTPVGRTRTFTTETLFPLIRNPSPRQNAEFVPLATSNVSFDLTDYQGDLMNWTVETQPDIGSGTGTDVANGSYTVLISGLEYFTTYTWFVNVTDGRYWTKKTFSFRTTTEKTVILEPTDDTTITENAPNGNSGASDTISLRSMSWVEWDGLIKFNLNTIPSNVTILYADLQTYYYNNHDGNPSGHQVNLYRITSDWNEDIITWNTHPSYVTEPSSSAIMPATINDWVFWNLTGDVQTFYNGGTPNYGWRIMDTSGDNIISYFQSKENSGNHPLLIIGYE